MDAGILMGRRKTGRQLEPEMQEIQDKIGAEAYGKLYAKIYTKTSNSGNKRYSGMHYCNTKEKLEAIKMKYANGVPVGEIEKMVRGENG